MNPAENWQTAAGPIAAEPEPAYAPPIAPAVVPPPLGRKNPGLAALLSLFPGMGNIYNGLYMRGMAFFLVIASLIALVSRGDHPLFGLAIAFFWLFNVIDAYRQATLINYGYAQDLGLLDMPKVPRAGQGGLVAGGLLALIGVAGILDQYFNINFDWIFNVWPFGLVAIGLWLIVASFRDRQRAR
jgi:hypothetical protein